MQQIGYALVTAMAALYILLAVQAEPVTKVLGFVAAGLLALSVITAIVRGR